MCYMYLLMENVIRNIVGTVRLILGSFVTMLINLVMMVVISFVLGLKMDFIVIKLLIVPTH